jgi:hypothetical protein
VTAASVTPAALELEAHVVVVSAWWRQPHRFRLAELLVASRERMGLVLRALEFARAPVVEEHAA